MDRSEQEIVDGLRNSAPLPPARLRNRILDAAMEDQSTSSRFVTSRARFSFRTGSGGMRYAVSVAALIAVYGATMVALNAQQRSLFEAGTRAQGSSVAAARTHSGSLSSLPSGGPGWDLRGGVGEGTSSTITLQSLEARSRNMMELLSPSLGEDHRSDQHGTI